MNAPRLQITSRRQHTGTPLTPPQPSPVVAPEQEQALTGYSSGTEGHKDTRARVNASVQRHTVAVVVKRALQNVHPVRAKYARGQETKPWGGGRRRRRAWCVGCVSGAVFRATAALPATQRVAQQLRRDFAAAVAVLRMPFSLPIAVGARVTSH